MKVCLIGPHAEDNLSIGYLTSSLRDAGQEVTMVIFDGPEAAQDVVDEVVRLGPDLMGISFSSQHRALESIEIAVRLRQEGFQGHLTCGGHFPTAVPGMLLERAEPFDSVVLHEGEGSVVALADALERGRDLGSVGSLVWRDGGAVRTNVSAPRVGDLDALPFPARDFPPMQDVGLVVAPVLGSRGCRNRCAFCSIKAFGSPHGDGPDVRIRSPENIASEMAGLYRRRSARVFLFHDDVLPLREGDGAGYYRAVEEDLARRGVERFFSICPLRPDLVDETVLPEVIRRLGIIRFYFGIESGSEAVLRRLKRGVSRKTVEGALAIIERNRIPGGTNILLIDPESTLADIEDSLRMMRRHPHVAYNFCKVEAYHGTPLHERLESGGRLSGSWLTATYRLADPAAEAAYQISMQVMRDRIEAIRGLLDSTMGLVHRVGILEAMGGGRDLAEQAWWLVRDVTLDTSDRLLEVVEFSRRAGRDELGAIADFASDAAFRCNEAGARFHGVINDLSLDIAGMIKGEGI